MREQVRAMVTGLRPWDEREAEAQHFVMDWIDSGAGLYRLIPPATPAPHLVSYFALIDGDHILLGDHRKSGLLLPCGGHVDQGEHPTDTVFREAEEELSIQADLLLPAPVFLTVTATVGADSHLDVSLWYALRGDRTKPYDFDQREYRGMSWYAFDDLPPAERTDPELHRFCQKLSSQLETV